MNRIKFRAWDNVDKVMRYPLAMVVDGRDEKFATAFFEENTNDNNGYRDFDELILEQFTGLLDKNGKEIYEGDVVKYDRDEGIVIYVNCEFALKLTKHETTQRGLLCDRMWHPVEIIGNVHEKGESC